MPEYTHLLKHIKFSKLLAFLETSLFPNFPSSSNPKFSVRLKSPFLPNSPKPPISLTSSYQALKHSSKSSPPPPKETANCIKILQIHPGPLSPHSPYDKISKPIHNSKFTIIFSLLASSKQNIQLPPKYAPSISQSH